MSKNFFETLNRLTDQECWTLFEIILTPKEYGHISARIQGLYMLMNGENYENIISKTNMSSRTIARLSRDLKEQPELRSLLKKLKDEGAEAIIA